MPPKNSYKIRAAKPDSWRVYDEENPDPGYFEFDWLSARHPDLYDKFALTTLGLMEELDKLVDLEGLTVADVGAGTGRATIHAAKRAKHVIAIDAYRSVVAYGKQRVKQAGLENVTYRIGDGRKLPLKDSSVAAVISVWAVLDYGEAYRVLKPDGYIIQGSSAPGSLCGELTVVLAKSYPKLIREVAPKEQFHRSYPIVDSIVEGTKWNGVSLVSPLRMHDFTYIADYKDNKEAAEIYGRLYGPLARKYMQNKQKTTVAYRLRICYGRVKK